MAPGAGFRMSDFPFLASLPNLITLGRLILVPLVIAMISNGRWLEAFVVFLIAGVSDAVDGFVAKRFDLRTELGAYLDPVADKALLVSIYVALALAQVVPGTLAIFVVARDIMIVGAVIISWVLHKPIAIRPLLISKLNTTAQIAFAAAVLGAKAFRLDLGLWFNASIALVAALTVASTAAYLKHWLDHMSR